MNAASSSIAAPEAPPKRRSLWPREHGAYAQLGAPLVAAIGAGATTAPALLLAIGACLAFLAHEPLLVVLGHRGRRMRELAGPRAWRLAIAGGAAAILVGAVGLALAPPATWIVAGLVALPVLTLLGFAWRRAERTVAGELVAGVALAGAAAPVAVAGGASLTAALVVWLAWSLGFAATVIAVHRVIARHRRPAAAIDQVTAIGLGATTVVIVAVLAVAPALAIAAPLCALSTALVIDPPPATRLRAIGVALLIASLVSCGLAILLA